jgi:acetoin utilization deacetylase AcuC-like enzyme
MVTGIIKDPLYLEHDMGPAHVESPARLKAIYEMLEKDFSVPLTLISPRKAKEQHLYLIHSSEYVRMIKETAGKERVILDLDTSTSARSYDAAVLAAGGVLQSVDAIMNHQINNGFALIRPPGHHAEASKAMGFCIFNNIAVAAAYLEKNYGIKRILIVDWDLHHGNGTQNSFYSSDNVLYFSTHQFPCFPGTGRWSEIGQGSGKGYTVNVPLFTGKNDQDYLFIFQKILAPIAAKFQPEFILVSAGFDIHKNDPLGGMLVSDEGFGALTSELLLMARKYSQGRLLFALEGGYSLDGLSGGVKQVLLQLSNEDLKPPPEAQPNPVTTQETASVIEILQDFWLL